MKAFILDRYGKEDGVRMGEVPDPELREGDRIAFLNAGGYGASMSSNHCMRGEFTERLL